jgi:hypothetical protein
MLFKAVIIVLYDECMEPSLWYTEQPVFVSCLAALCYKSLEGILPAVRFIFTAHISAAVLRYMTAKRSVLLAAGYVNF